MIAESVGNCIWNVTAEEYHADKSKISNSLIKIFRPSPGRYKGVTEGTIELDVETNATRLGSLKHIAALEPDRWDDFVAEIPDEVLAKNGAKSTIAYREWSEDHQGMILAKRGELDTVRGMIDALHRHRIAGPILREPGDREQALTWIDEETGLRCKCRRDLVIGGNSRIYDLKKCRDPSPDGFSGAAGEYGYYVQQAFYEFGHAEVFGEDIERFRFICISDTKPYQIAVNYLNATAVELGRQQVRKALDDISRCMVTGVWESDWELKENECGLRPWLVRAL